MRPPALVVGIVAVAGVASHVVLDALSLVTYHPAHAGFHDPFWVGYHATAYALMIYLVCRLRARWLGIVFALLPDLDWIQRDGARLFGAAPLWRPGALHDFFASLPGLSTLVSLADRFLPNWHERRWAAVPELAIGFAAAFYVSRARKPG